MTNNIHDLYVAPPTDPETFWNAVGATLGFRGSEMRQINALTNQLALLTKEGLLGFQADYARMHHKAMTQNILCACLLLNGTASSDTFHYFCDWLISVGRTAFEGTLEDPDRLVEFLPSPVAAPRFFCFEEFGYVAGDVYEARFNEEVPSLNLKSLGLSPVNLPASTPAGELGDIYPLLGEWVSERNEAIADLEQL